MAKNEEKTLEQLKAEAELATLAYETAWKAEEQKKKEEAERKKAELMAEKDKRKKEVDNTINNAIELLKKYIDDYGSFSTDSINDLTFLFGSKPWRWFL